MSAEQSKKVIRLQTPTMQKPISIRCEPGMEEMTLAEIVDSIASQYDANSQAVEAQAIRGLVSRAVMHNGNQQQMTTKVKDLTFTMRSTKAGDALVADLQFAEPYTGGNL